MRKFLFVLGFTGVSAVVMAGAACSNSSPNDGRIDLPKRPEDAMVDSAVTPDPMDSAVSCKNLALKVGEPARAQMTQIGHVEKGIATAAMILVRFATLWFAVLVGFIALSWMKRRHPGLLAKDDPNVAALTKKA